MKIYIPHDTSSISLGADEIAAAIAERFPDFDIVRNGSRGLYWLEPLIEIETSKGRVGFGPVTVDDLPSLFNSGFPENASKHPLYLGKIDDLDAIKRQNRLAFTHCGIAEALAINEYKFQALDKALKMKPQKIIEEIKASGLRGRGGAAFPTGIKWQTVSDTKSDKKFIVCNADEGDSGTFADRMLMEGDPYCLIEGMIVSALAVDATQGYIYLRSEYPNTHKILRTAIDRAYKYKYLGKNIRGSRKNFDLEIRMGAGAYICGEETALLESLEGKRGMIRYRPPLPAVSGLFGKPTIINNVMTLATVPYILANGAAAYKNHGVGNSKGTLTIQLCGNVKYPGLYEMDFGIPLRELLYDIGGGTATGRPIKTVQCGGPLGAYLHDSQFNLPMTYEDFAAQGAMLGHGGVVVFDDSVNMAQQARYAMEFCSIESCGKCTPCRIGSVRGVEVIDKIIANTDQEMNLKLLEDLCETMTEGSLCAMGGLTPAPVLSALKYFPEDFGLQRRKKAA